MKITTIKINASEYDVFKDGIFVGSISELQSGEWAAYDINNDWIETANTKLRCLKWCFE